MAKSASLEPVDFPLALALSKLGIFIVHLHNIYVRCFSCFRGDFYYVICLVLCLEAGL